MDIKKQIQGIKNEIDNPEEAHELEDELYLNFVQYVAKLDIPKVSNQAKLILTTQDLWFSRWFG